MLCPKCGETIPDDSKFCSNCAAKIEGVVAESPTPTGIAATAAAKPVAVTTVVEPAVAAESAAEAEAATAVEPVAVAETTEVRATVQPTAQVPKQVIPQQPIPVQSSPAQPAFNSAQPAAQPFSSTINELKKRPILQLASLAILIVGAIILLVDVIEFFVGLFGTTSLHISFTGVLSFLFYLIPIAAVLIIAYIFYSSSSKPRKSSFLIAAAGVALGISGYVCISALSAFLIRMIYMLNYMSGDTFLSVLGALAMLVLWAAMVTASIVLVKESMKKV